MSEIETGPRTKQPWEYQVGWARQNLLPSELGYFVKGLLGGLYVPSTSQTRPDRVDRDAKELNRRAQKTQEAQNKFRFWTRAAADVKNNADINFINMLRQKEQERLKSMQTENNKTFNTLYNKFLLLEKNKFKLKANIIKHLSTGNRYLKENKDQQVEIQDEDPLGNWTSPLMGLGYLALGLGGIATRGLLTKIALNRKHAALTKEIQKINKKSFSNDMKQLQKSGAAERISSKIDDYGKLGNMLNSKVLKYTALGVPGVAHAVYGFNKDLEDRERGYGNLTNSQIWTNVFSRALTPYLSYMMGRGLGSALPGLKRGSPRYVAREWSKKHKKLGNNKTANAWRAKYPDSPKAASAEASKLLTDRIKSGGLPHPKYKGNEFGLIYNNNPNFGVAAVKDKIPISKIWANNAGTGKFKRPLKTALELATNQPRLAMNTGIGSGAAAAVAGSLAMGKDELLSGIGYVKGGLENIDLFGLGDLIDTIVPYDPGVQGSYINALTNTDSTIRNPAAETRGYRTLRTKDRTGWNQEERERRRGSVITNTTPHGKVSSRPTDPDANSPYLIVNPDRSFVNRIVPYFSGDRGRTAVIRTNNVSGPISNRSRPATEEEKEKFERQLERERNDY